MSNQSESLIRWINSLDPSLSVSDIQEDLRDGYVLAQIIDIIKPGLISFRSLQRPSPGRQLNRFALLGNCNYVLDKLSEIGVSLVNIHASNLAEGDTKLLYSLLTQLQRKLLISTHFATSSNVPNDVSDSQILALSNPVVAEVGGVEVNSIRSEEVKSGRYLVWLLTAVFGQSEVIGLCCSSESLCVSDLVSKCQSLLESSVYVTERDILNGNSKTIGPLIMAILAKRKVTNKQEEITDKQEEITDKQEEITNKQEEIMTPVTFEIKAEEPSLVSTIKSNLSLFESDHDSSTDNEEDDDEEEESFIDSTVEESIDSGLADSDSQSDSDSQLDSDSDFALFEEEVVVETPIVEDEFCETTNWENEMALLLGVSDVSEFITVQKEGGHQSESDLIADPDYELLDHVITHSSLDLSAQKSKEVTQHPLEMEGPPLPDNYHEFSQHLSDLLIVRAFLPNNVKQTVRVKHDQTVQSLLDQLWVKFRKTNPDYDITERDFAIKISGKSEFFVGNSPLFHYSSVFDVLLEKPSILDISFMPIEDFNGWFSFFNTNNRSENDHNDVLTRVADVSLPKELSLSDSYNHRDVSAPFTVKIHGISNIFPTTSRLLSQLNKLKGTDDLFRSNLYILGSCSVVFGDKVISKPKTTLLSMLTCQNVFFEDTEIELSKEVSQIPNGSRLVLNFFALTKPPGDDVSNNVTADDNDISEDQKYSSTPLFDLVSAVVNSVQPVPTRSFVYKQKKHAPPPFAPRIIKHGGISLCPVVALSLPLFDSSNKLVSGINQFDLWTDCVADHVKASFPAPNVVFHSGEFLTSPKVELEFPEFEKEILAGKHYTNNLVSNLLFPFSNQNDNQISNQTVNQEDDQEPSEEERNILDFYMLNPLKKGNENEIELLFKYKNTKFIRKYSSFLPKILSNLNYSSHSEYDFATSLLKLAQNDPNFDLDCFDLIGLLSPSSPSPEHRSLIARILLTHSNDPLLVDIMLQLCAVLKYEAHHFNLLAIGLLLRALKSPFFFGHYFFWFLKAELHDLKVRKRFGCYLYLFLKHCTPETRYFLRKQAFVVNSLMSIADSVRATPKPERLTVLRESLEEIQASNKWPQNFALPLNPKLELCKIRTEKCKVMDTKKCPLWLTFINADEYDSEVSIIFKKEDDMRQDVLVLQVFNLFDRVWRSHGLFLEMSIYRAISCGKFVGMVEVVKDSMTTAQISTKYSKNRMKFNQAFDKYVIDRFLKKKNPTPESLSKAVSNFSKSLAAYCVATFVLGIGDRHSDNVMISKLGRLFHIDFGHILGNYKYFKGIPREKAPFVFTPDFAYALGYYNKKRKQSDPNHFNQFVDYSIAALKVLRQNAKIPINALSLMIHSGLPELMSSLDVEWVMGSLMLDSTEDVVEERFEKLIHESLNALSTLLNNAVHLMAH
ncbi:hypothetical protein P9112_000829 [Eukaryota sp. TZLM1-RC]